MLKRILTYCICPLLCATGQYTCATGNSDEDLESFLDMNLEDLLTVDVTSVSKRKQKLTETAAAVFVITNEDIKRSGVTSIPEALRLAPGVQVARLDNNTWAISSRGFNAEFANKLLVLIDGRSVYTPSFSGVYWDNQDTLLADIDRIEVIRGPGATLWGANAVNGVINIMTKSAAETTGLLAHVNVGDEENAIARIRYGATFDNGFAAKAYLKFADREASYSPDLDDEANDDWRSRRAGFRLDGVSGSNKWTLQGDAFANDIDQTVDEIIRDPDDPANNPPNPVSPYIDTNVEDSIKARGQHLIGRWEKQMSPTSLTTLQLYYDHTDREEEFAGQDISTFDVDFNHSLSGFQGHEIIWGLGYRRSDDKFKNTFAISLLPEKQTSELYSLFLQDEIAIEENLRLTVGSKVEHNRYTGFELQPSVKLIWLPEAGISLWSSLSRAARTPSDVERRGRVNVGLIPGVPPPYCYYHRIR